MSLPRRLGPPSAWCPGYLSPTTGSLVGGTHGNCPSSPPWHSQAWRLGLSRKKTVLWSSLCCSQITAARPASLGAAMSQPLAELRFGQDVPCSWLSQVSPCWMGTREHGTQRATFIFAAHPRVLHHLAPPQRCVVSGTGSHCL